MSIGNTGNIHGWNPNFRDIQTNTNQPQFHAFDWNQLANHPDKFHNLTVNGNYTTPPILLDHQGHIVPQNMLDLVLSPIANAVYALHPQPQDLTQLNAHLTGQYPNLNFGYVTQYIQNKLITAGVSNPTSFVQPGQVANPTPNDVEAYCGGYFSVIMWNPVNIARAPSDDYRGQYPKQQVDEQVLQYLISHSTQQGIQLSSQMNSAFTRMPSNPPINLNDIESFIASTNESLSHQSNNTLQGYYKFNWKDQPNLPVTATVLIPD